MIERTARAGSRSAPALVARGRALREVLKTRRPRRLRHSRRSRCARDPRGPSPCAVQRASSPPPGSTTLRAAAHRDARSRAHRHADPTVGFHCGSATGPLSHFGWVREESRIELVDGAGGAGGGLAPPGPTCSRVRPLLPRGAALDVALRLGGALVGYASRVELLTAWASWRIAAIWRGNAGWWRVGASAASGAYILRRCRGSAPSVVRWSVAGALAARNTM